ncbi:MAG: hypothetical protein ABFD96_13720, partial [Armatimonadia bacterium]
MLAAAVHGPASGQPAWTILAYLEARGGLTEAAQHYQSQLANTARKQGYNLATIMLPDHVDRNSAERCLIQASGARTDDRVPLPKGSV